MRAKLIGKKFVVYFMVLFIVVCLDYNGINFKFNQVKCYMNGVANRV